MSLLYVTKVTKCNKKVLDMQNVMELIIEVNGVKTVAMIDSGAY